MLTYLLFIVGFFLLIKGADILVDGASSIAKKFSISPIVIGLTVVSFGTSAPELIVNILSALSGNTEIALGNVLGSNIANILLILGISAFIFPLTVERNTVWKEIPFSLLAAILLAVMVNDYRIEGSAFSGLGRIDGLALISFFIIFMFYTFGLSKVKKNGIEEPEIKKLSNIQSLFYVIGGIGALVIGGKWLVDGAVQVAESLNVSQSLIALTVVAIGTSLPELATSVVAAYKKQSDIAIGNVVGSNIFNTFWILGLTSLINPLPFQTSSDKDIIINVIVHILLFILIFIGKRHIIERWQGACMLVAYIAYIFYLIQIG